MIVFDSSPLIHLTQIGKMNYIFQLFKDIIIPYAVFDEVVNKGIEKKQSDAFIIQDYIDSGKIRYLKSPLENHLYKNILHEGERECILLAKERNALAIIDERKARYVARNQQITFHGTMGILYILLKQKIIDKTNYLNNLAKFSDNGWISIRLYEQYRRLGENYE